MVLFGFAEQTANYDQQKQRNRRDDGDDHVQSVRGDAGIVCGRSVGREKEIEESSLGELINWL